MKKLILPIVVLLTLVVGCEKDASIDIPIELNKEFTLHVIVPIGVSEDSTKVDETIEPNDELQEYLDKIKTFTIDSANYRLTNLTGGNGGDGNDCVFSAEYEVSANDQFFFSEIIAATSDPKSLKELIDLGSKSLTIDNQDALLELLKAGGTIKKEMSSLVNNSSLAPYEFDIILKINGKAIVTVDGE